MALYTLVVLLVILALSVTAEETENTIDENSTRKMEGKDFMEIEPRLRSHLQKENENSEQVTPNGHRISMVMGHPKNDKVRTDCLFDVVM